MSKQVYLPYHDDSLAGRIARKAFPGNRKDFSVRAFQGPMNVNSYWDGGSRSAYVMIRLDDMSTATLPTSTHPIFDRKANGERCGNLELNKLPPNTALVSGGTFRGKPASVTVYVSEENLTPLLPKPIELDESELSALQTIRSTKGGQHRRDEFARAKLGPYSLENPLIIRLLKLKLIKANKAGAITVTTAGRNTD